MKRAAVPLLLFLAQAACRSNNAAPPPQPKPTDGGDDGPGYAPAPNALDIAVTGCASSKIESGTEMCSGPAPFTVTFSPVGTPGLTSFVWDFGDGSPPSSEVAPVHTYSIPGRYDVSVKGSSALIGTIPATRPGLIVALPVAAGAACDVKAQCADGLDCVSKAGDGCSPAFARGICSRDCTNGFCGSGAVCAAYALGAGSPAGTGPADGGGSQLNPVCLADCGDGVGCPAGFVCQSFHAGGSTANGWVRGCLPAGAAGDLGASCRTASGALDHARCASGFCSAAATNGFCSASCQQPLTCPAGAACAWLTTGQICLPACTSDQSCSGDPSVACQNLTAADAGVDGGVPVVTGDLTQMYCVPGSH